MDRDEALAAVHSLIGAEGVAAARAPIEQASGLPNRAYTDPAWFTLERERIFGRSWVFVCAEAELDTPGTQRPAEVAGAPVLVVRSEDRIRAHHNVCRHRGALLLDRPCRRSTITCPYHQWTYGLGGDLRSRPHFDGPGVNSRFDGDAGPDLDLVPVRCETWNGCVFVTLDPSTPPLAEWIAPLVEATPAYDLGAVRWAGKLTFEVDANWKLVFENFMEGYHVFLDPSRPAPARPRCTPAGRGSGSARCSTTATSRRS